MGLKSGTRLGQYEILEPLGRGGMATVYRATQPALGREVAIKVLPEFLTDDPAFHERFRQEARSVASLRHTNILTVFDSGDADGIAYIVMELVDGGTLASRMGQPMAIDRVLAIATGIASALDYAHARGVIHRDIKPGNILFTRDNTPILADFGLARMGLGAAPGEAATRLTVAGGSIGTPEYMSPEQIDSSNVGPPTDIYAFAMTLYQMLTGTLPYEAETPLKVLQMRLSTPLPLPRERNPSMPPAVQDVLLKGLATRPDDRYATAGDMIRALEDASGSTTAIAAAAAPTIITPPPAAAQAPARAGTPEPARRGSSKATLPSILIAAGVVIAAGAVWVTRSGAPAPVTQSASSTTAASSSGQVIPAPQVPAQSGPSLPPPPSTTTSSSPQPASPVAAPAPAAPARDGRAAAAGSLPPHGRLLYSIADHPPDLSSIKLANDADAVTATGAGLTFHTASDSGAFVQLPVSGLGDFVARLRYTATTPQAWLNVRLRVSRALVGLAVHLPADMRLTPAAAGARASAPQPCCQPFDLYRAPSPPGTPTLFAGPSPVAVQAVGEPQEIAIAASGPVVTISSRGQELARVSDDTFGPGMITLNVGKSRNIAVADVRVDAFEIYEPATLPPPAPPVSHGKLIYSIDGHAAELAATRQQHSEDTIAVASGALEFTSASDTAMFMPLPVFGVGDFVATMKFATVSGQPSFMFRFHKGAGPGDYVVQFPAFLHLAPAGGAALGPGPCCQDFDIYTTPMARNQPSLVTGPAVLSVPGAPHEAHDVTISARGPLVVILDNGFEIARFSDATFGTGSFSLQVNRKARKFGPAVLRLSALEIFEQAPVR